MMHGACDTLFDTLNVKRCYGLGLMSAASYRPVLLIHPEQILLPVLVISGFAVPSMMLFVIDPIDSNISIIVGPSEAGF